MEFDRPSERGPEKDCWFLTDVSTADSEDDFRAQDVETSVTIYSPSIKFDPDNISKTKQKQHNTLNPHRNR